MNNIRLVVPAIVMLTIISIMKVIEVGFDPLNVPPLLWFLSAKGLVHVVIDLVDYKNKRIKR